MSLDPPSDWQLEGNMSHMSAADIARVLNLIQRDFADLGPRLHEGITQAIESTSGMDAETKAEVLSRLSPSSSGSQQPYLGLLRDRVEFDTPCDHDDLTAQSLESPEWGHKLDSWVLSSALDRKIPALEAVAILRNGPAVGAMQMRGVGESKVVRYLLATSNAYQQALDSTSSSKIPDFLRERPSSPDLTEVGQSAVHLDPFEQEPETEPLFSAPPHEDLGGVELE